MHARLCLTAAVLALLAGHAAAAGAGGLKPTIADDSGDDTASRPAAKSADDTDPYAALGIKAGGFILYPSLTIGLGYTTNAAAAAGGVPSSFGSVTPELLIQSNWDRNAASLDLKGTYQDFFSDSADNDPQASAEATGRLDLPHGWTSDLDAMVEYDRETLTDDDNPPDGPSGVTSITSSADLTGDIGSAAVTITGTADRTTYENTTTGGVSVDQSDRNNDVFGARLRVGYDTNAALTPFVEGEVDRTVFDRQLDDHGIARAGTGYALRGGVSFDNDPVLSGEIALGARQQTFDDATLAAFSAFTVDGDLVWSPSRLTTVTFDASTTVDPGTDPSSSGSVVHDASLELAYDWRDNLTISGKGEVSREDYQGTGEVDDTYDLGVNAEWKLNRTLSLNAGYTHEWLVSTDATSNYQSDTVKLELRAQR